MNTKNIFSGIFFITLGTLWILKSLEFITFSWLDFLRLWPVLFIFIGISMIPIKDWIKLVLQILMLAFTIGLLFVSDSDCSIHSTRKYRIEKITDTLMVEEETMNDISLTEDSIKFASLNLSLTACKVSFVKGTNLFELADSTSNGKGEIEIQKIIKKDKAEIDVELYPVEERNNFVPRFKVALGANPIWDLNIDIQATESDLDLSAFKVEKVTVVAQASAVKLKLGSLQPNVKVVVESGASSVTLKVPKNMKCIVKKDNVLSSFSVKGLKKQEDGTYVSSETVKSIGVIEISIAADVSSVDVIRY